MALDRKVWTSLFAATAWALLAWLAMWWQPILADEWDFYRSITNWQQERGLIPHPQAYIHLAQLSMAIFGQSVGAARLVGVLGAIVSLWLIPLLIRFTWPDHPHQSRMAVIGIGLTALNPLTPQNAMLLDIDNTLLTPVLMIVACVWAGMQPARPRNRIAALSVTLAVALWVKLPTPPLLMGSLELYHLIRREWRRAAEIVIASLLGLALFGATFAAYSLFSGYQFAYFAATFGRAPGFFNLRDLVARFPQGMGVFVMWLSLPLTILIGIALAASSRRLARRQSIPADALSLYVIIVTLFYTLFHIPAWGYPRYQAPLVPIVSLLVAALLAPFTLNLSQSMRRGFVALIAIMFALNLVVLPDPLWPVYQVTFESDLYDVGRRLQAGLSIVAVLAVPIAGALGLGMILARARRIDSRPTLIHALSALMIASLAATTLAQIVADYSTRYRYTYNYADYLWSVQQAQSAGASAYILAIKDVLYESKRAGEEIYPYLCASCSSTLLDTLRSRRVDALVWTTKEDVRSSAVTADPVIVATLADCYARMTRGVFIVYQLKSDSPCF